MARTTENITGAEYGIAWAAFLPGLGVLLGLAVIILGAMKMKAGGWKLILLGMAGIVAGTGAGGFLIYRNFFDVRHRTFAASIYKEISAEHLRQTVMAIEYHKVIRGTYPAKLDDLIASSRHGTRGETYLYDDSTVGLHMQQHQYQLQPDGQHYVLFDVGPDGVSGTADDLYPDLSVEEAPHVGWNRN